MTEYLDIGPTPADEPCAQVGEDDYTSRARAECRRYARLIMQAYPRAIAVMRSHPHDLGTYYEVAIRYDDDDDAQTELAYHIEETIPLTWAELERMADDQTPYNQKETTMHDLNSVLLEGEIKVSPIYTEHPDGLTARFIIASTRRPKDADPVTVIVPVVAQGRLATMLRERWTPVTCIRAVGRLVPDTQPDTAPLAILAEHIEYRT